MASIPKPIGEISHTPSKLDLFLEKNQKKLVALAIVIFLGVLAYVFLKGYKKMQEERAGSLLLEASNTEEYNKVIEAHSSRAAATTAEYFIATSYTSDVEAIAALSDFIAKHPKHSLASLAEFNLAQRQINTDQLDEAKAGLETLLERENADFITAKASILLGDIALIRGEKELAEQYYNEAIQVNNSEHRFVKEAQVKIDYISAAKPAVVKTPAKIDTLEPQPDKQIEKPSLDGAVPPAETDPIQETPAP